METSVLPTMQAEARDASANILSQLDEISSRLQAMSGMPWAGDFPCPLDSTGGSAKLEAAQQNEMTLKKLDMLAIRRLLSKRSGLRDALDTLETAVTLQNAYGMPIRQAVGSERATNGYPRRCSCMPYKMTQRRHVKLGLSQFVTAQTTTSNHHQFCELYGTAVARFETRRLVIARLQYFTVAVEAALRISSSWQQGAGGFSLSPCLKYNSVVDRRKAPAFRLFNVLVGLMMSDRNRRIILGQTETMKALLDHVLTKLRALLEARKCSITDIDKDGNTLGHMLFKLMHIYAICERSQLEHLQELFPSFFWQMTEVYGVSVVEENYHGRTPYTDRLWREGSDEAMLFSHSVLPRDKQGTLQCPVARDSQFPLWFPDPSPFRYGSSERGNSPRRG
ncbi:uncharacterized protein B0I36DRAFT_331399 [Microdochium trichocladiopsis]|uniref:Uncharacterized protein n=1 Tax=Microdochium trichocladiopsis TaxID=1682393 RepID=A0A9P8XXJ2_9PEZI|nr:uncharacterized protein B0I36DRAFT_331399 [Microdochium trichocladiopsis]KAH7024425.1 hypothetical protein B0I36DRAFT_331399 [Microdochium trichocladiopsis]